MSHCLTDFTLFQDVWILDFNGFDGIEFPMADTVRMWRSVVCRDTNKNLNETEGNILLNVGSSSRRR